MKKDPMIDRETYTKIVNLMPILTVDILINKSGKFLLLRRVNEPLKGVYWTPGGRILKGERAIQAARRKVIEETGLKPKKIRLLGYYETLSKKNIFGLDSIHTTSIVFECTDFTGKIKLDNQHIDYKWSNTIPRQFIIRRT